MKYVRVDKDWHAYSVTCDSRSPVLSATFFMQCTQKKLCSQVERLGALVNFAKRRQKKTTVELSGVSEHQDITNGWAYCTLQMTKRQWSSPQMFRICPCVLTGRCHFDSFVSFFQIATDPSKTSSSKHNFRIRWSFGSVRSHQFVPTNFLQ